MEAVARRPQELRWKSCYLIASSYPQNQNSHAYWNHNLVSSSCHLTLSCPSLPSLNCLPHCPIHFDSLVVAVHACLHDFPLSTTLRPLLPLLLMRRSRTLGLAAVLLPRPQLPLWTSTLLVFGAVDDSHKEVEDHPHRLRHLPTRQNSRQRRLSVSEVLHLE